MSRAYTPERLISRTALVESYEATWRGSSQEQRVLLLRFLQPMPEPPHNLPQLLGDSLRLRCSGVVAALDFGMMDGRIYLALEPVPAEQIRALPGGVGRLPEPVVLAIGQQLAATLARAHQPRGDRQSTVHGALGAHSLGVTAGGEVFVADFVTSKILRWLAGKLSEKKPADDIRDLCQLLGELGGRRNRLFNPLCPELTEILEEGQAAHVDAERLATRLGRLCWARTRLSPTEVVARWASGASLATVPEKSDHTTRVARDLFDVQKVLPEEPAARPTVRDLSATQEVPVVVQLRPEQFLEQTLHGFRLTRVLGHGATAWVYHGRHIFLDRECAVKLMRGLLAGSAEAQQRIRREAVALARLNHPHIVRLLDFGLTTNETPFLLVEYVQGRTLRELVQSQGPLSAQRVARLGAQLAHGLSHAHELGIVHRDLKPSNIMLVDGPADFPKILDFGAVKLVHEAVGLTQPNQLLGTPSTMAPEQIQQAHLAGPAVDIYALGVALYFMLTGRYPFEGGLSQIMHHHLHSPPPPVPDGLFAPLLQRMLAKAPEQRPSAPDVWLQLERMATEVISDDKHLAGRRLF